MLSADPMWLKLYLLIFLTALVLLVYHLISALGWVGTGFRQFRSPRNRFRSVPKNHMQFYFDPVKTQKYKCSREEQISR
jgi:hypothetical protein